MKAVIVGCGMMAAGWVTAIRQSPLIGGRIEIVGLVDPDLQRAEKFALTHGLSNLPKFSDIESALKKTAPDVVFDVTPPSARAEVVEAAVNAGAHVLSEKPMAASYGEAQSLAALAEKRDKIFSVAQNRRYKKSIRQIEAFLSSGTLGNITGIHTDFFIAARFGGFRNQMKHVLLLDMAVHHFDAARFMTGQNARSVYCHEANPPASWYDGGASAFAIFEMCGGCVFTYRGSWCAEGPRTSWDAVWRITGSEGTLLWDGLDNIEARIGHGELSFLRETKLVEVPALSSEHQAQEHASVISAFLDSVAAGERPETDSSDNLHSMAMVFAAIESANTGKPVKIQGGISPQ